MSEFPGYRFLLGPEQLRLGPIGQVNNSGDYLAWHSFVVIGRGAVPWESKASILARINHGRWIADCRYCESGMFTRPDWQVAYCAECGARYSKGLVLFPLDTESITEFLLKRVKRSEQNWESPQSLEELQQENRELGIWTI